MEAPMFKAIFGLLILPLGIIILAIILGLKKGGSK